MAIEDLQEISTTAVRPGRKRVYTDPVRRSAYLEREAYEGIRLLGEGSFSQGVYHLWLSHSASSSQSMSNDD